MTNKDQVKKTGQGSQEFRESIFKYFFLLCALLSVFFIILITVFIFQGGWNIFETVGLKDFIFNTKWAPRNESFGIGSMIVGSIIVTAIACIIAVPVSKYTSAFLAYDCPSKLYRILKPGLNLMAGIPSIVYGFFALTFIVPKVRDILGSGTGMTLLTAGILLSIMILPTIISISETSIRAVPKHFYTGSVALGATHERTILKVILPAAKSGIFAGIILGVGRAIGETMAVILIAGNQTRFNLNPLKGGRTMTTNIVMEMGYATGMHREALIATACVLFVFILLINLAFYFFKKRSDI